MGDTMTHSDTQQPGKATMNLPLRTLVRRCASLCISMPLPLKLARRGKLALRAVGHRWMALHIVGCRWMLVDVDRRGKLALGTKAEAGVTIGPAACPTSRCHARHNDAQQHTTTRGTSHHLPTACKAPQPPGPRHLFINMHQCGSWLSLAPLVVTGRLSTK